MRTAPALAAEPKTTDVWEEWPSGPVSLLAWEGDSKPRLEPGDLNDPSSYYRRLEAWLMKQK